MNHRRAVIALATMSFLVLSWGTCLAAAVPKRMISLEKAARAKTFAWFTKENAVSRCPSRPYAAFDSPPAEMKESLTMDDLIGRSNLIIDGTVVAIEACAPKRQDGMIVTYVTFAIREVIAGDAPAGEGAITLPFIGGCAGGYCEDHEGQPRWAHKDRAILFIRQGRPFPVAGGTKGIFFVTREGEVTNYDGQPFIGTAAGRYAIDFTVPPVHRDVDDAIDGGIEIARAKKEEARSCIECSDHVAVAAKRISGRPVPVDEFIELVRERREALSPPAFPPVRIVPAGTGFEWPLHAASIAPIGGGK